MKEARYVGPVEGESAAEKYARTTDNWFRFKTFYFDILQRLPADDQFEIAERYHIDQPVYRDEVLAMAEKGKVEIPDYIAKGDMDPRFYEEEIYKRQVPWMEV